MGKIVGGEYHLQTRKKKTNDLETYSLPPSDLRILILEEN